MRVLWRMRRVRRSGGHGLVAWRRRCRLCHHQSEREKCVVYAMSLEEEEVVRLSFFELRRGDEAW